MIKRTLKKKNTNKKTLKRFKKVRRVRKNNLQGGTHNYQELKEKYYKSKYEKTYIKGTKIDGNEDDEFFITNISVDRSNDDVVVEVSDSKANVFNGCIRKMCLNNSDLDNILCFEKGKLKYNGKSIFDYYEGEFNNYNKFNGKGKLIFKEDSDITEINGTFEKGNCNEGIIKYKNGEIITGSWNQSNNEVKNKTPNSFSRFIRKTQAKLTS